MTEQPDRSTRDLIVDNRTGASARPLGGRPPARAPRRAPERSCRFSAGPVVATGSQMTRASARQSRMRLMSSLSGAHGSSRPPPVRETHAVRNADEARIRLSPKIFDRSRGVTSGMGNLLGGLEHRAEGLEHERALLPRVVRAEE